VVLRKVPSADFPGEISGGIRRGVGEVLLGGAFGRFSPGLERPGYSEKAPPGLGIGFWGVGFNGERKSVFLEKRCGGQVMRNRQCEGEVSAKANDSGMREQNQRKEQSEGMNSSR